jgi:glycosyltransferase involved in cell wall biosynthesis
VEIVYFKGNEKRRLWSFQMGSHPKTVLPAWTITTGGTERFFNPGLISLLLNRKPKTVLLFTCMKDPSGWIAMLLCRLIRAKVALLDDTWLGRDRGIGPFQRLARWITYMYLGDAFVGASLQTLNMAKHYNPRISHDQCFLSHLVADNDYFKQRLNGSTIERHYDVLYAGRIAAEKNPVFFAQVCAGIKKQRGECRVLIIGSGRDDLKTGMQAVFDEHGVDYNFAGFISHDKLPKYYAQAKLLFLPTSGDCWGVVINEAMVSGTPVITTEMTAAAGELVLHNENGFILPLQRDAWVNAAVDLLGNEAKWAAFSQKAAAKVQEFNYDNAAEGILASFRYLASLSKRNRPSD